MYALRHKNNNKYQPIAMNNTQYKNIIKILPTK